jgi:dinuclear metal center YbgI/SA1388 family protein
VNRSELVTYLDNYLRIAEIQDYGPQGLQVEADNEHVQRLALAVDTAPAVIKAAAVWGADMLLVHHGILWRTVERLAGPLGHRLRLVLANRINLYAAHLPLDAHPEVGNNAVLARLLDVAPETWWAAPTGTPIGILGQVPNNTTLAAFHRRVEKKLSTIVRVLEGGPPVIERVAILSGAGAADAAEAHALGADTFLTGETSHAHYWAAADYGLNILYAGHYATETVGVQALGAHLQTKFGLETKFFDFPTAM